MNVYHVLTVPTETRTRNQFPGTGIKDGHEALNGYWASNLVPLAEEPVFLWAEPSLYPINYKFSQMPFIQLKIFSLVIC